MTNTDKKTLRLIFPQWQGGNNPPYYLGSQLLSWLAPSSTDIVEEVAIPFPTNETLPIEDGLVAREALLEQLNQARKIIDKHRPDSLVVLGGDCLVDLAPFSYLNERYDGDLALLWIDAHPDIMTPKQFEHAHAMVLGNLLGHGDDDFTKSVAQPIKPENVLLVGLNEPSEWEAKKIQELNLSVVTPGELAEKRSQPVLDWFKATGCSHLAVHFDLDALDSSIFRGLLFAQPDIPTDTFDGISQGKLTMEQIVRLLGDVSKVTEVVGLGITEYMPWDALALKNMLEKLPLIGIPDTP